VGRPTQHRSHVADPPSAKTEVGCGHQALPSRWSGHAAVSAISAALHDRLRAVDVGPPITTSTMDFRPRDFDQGIEAGAVQSPHVHAAKKNENTIHLSVARTDTLPGTTEFRSQAMHIEVQPAVLMGRHQTTVAALWFGVKVLVDQNVTVVLTIGDVVDDENLVDPLAAAASPTRSMP